MSDVLVSVVIPTHNRLGYLKQATASVKAQTLTGCEVVVVDVASTDGTDEWLDGARGSGFQTFRLDEKMPPSRPRNLGLTAARGNNVLFLDDDDRLIDSGLERLFRSLQRHPEAPYAVGARLEMDDAGQRKRARHPRTPLRRQISHDLLCGFTILTSQVLFRRNELLEVGGWDESLDHGMDRDLLLRLTEAGPPSLVPNTVVIYRRHTSQFSGEVAYPSELPHWRRYATSSEKEQATILACLEVRRRRYKGEKAFQQDDYSTALAEYVRAVRAGRALLLSRLVGPMLVWGLTKSLAGFVMGRRLTRAVRKFKTTLRRARRRDPGGEIARG